MDFEFTPEQQILRESVRQFVRDHDRREYREEARRTGSASKKVWRAMTKAGWMGVTIPVEYGGIGTNIVEQAVILEELAPIQDLIGPFFNTVCFGANSIGHFGSEAQKREYLPKISRGEITFGASITEPGGGTDVLGALRTRAREDGDSWVITGQKVFSSYAGVVDNLIVVARTSPAGEGRKAIHGVSIFIVPTKAEGIRMRPIPLAVGGSRSETYEVWYDDVRVPKENLLGERDRGFYHFFSTLNNERICIAAMVLGAAQCAYEKAVKYAKERHAFGKPIGQLQAIQHYIADMITEIELGRLILYKAATLQAEGKPCGVEATMAKYFISEMGCRVTDKAIQIHGGYGFTEEFDLFRYYTMARILRVGPVTSEQSRNLIAEMVAGLPRSY